MATKRKFKSDAFEAIHSAVEGMFAAGTIDKETMRTFDEDCLVIPQELSPGEIKALREDNHVSQPVFARYLNTSQSTVQKWETGAKRASAQAPLARAKSRAADACVGAYTADHYKASMLRRQLD